MYLERVISKGNYYLYLKAYSVREHYRKPYVTVYKFGRIEKAFRDMKGWKKDFSTFPKELLSLGCTKKDLDFWLLSLETGIHQRTGRKFDLETVRKEA